MIHVRNLQKLAIEMFKVNNKQSVQKFHFAENHYNFRHQSGTKFKVDHVKLNHTANNLYHISDLKPKFPTTRNKMFLVSALNKEIIIIGIM